MTSKYIMHDFLQVLNKEKLQVHQQELLGGVILDLFTQLI